MNKARAADLARDTEIHPVVLDRMMTKLYPDWLMMEPETTLTLLRSLLEGGEPNPILRSKINALKVIHNSEAPWEDWEAFQWVCQAINGNMADFSNMYRPELGELLVAIEVLDEIRKMPFSDEVRRWITACCLDIGLVWVPEPLSFINPLLASVEYRCTRCGNVDMDDENEVCDTCGAPDSALVRQPKYVDPEIIKEAWGTIQMDPVDRIHFTESVKGVHLARLAAATIMAADTRQRMKEEMDYVRG